MNPVPIPLDDPIAQPKRESFGKQKDPQEGRVTRSWVDWFTQLGTTIEQTATRTGTAVALTAQAADISPTDFSGGTLPTGLYRVTWYVRPTQAATTSSGIQVILDWTDGGQAVSFSGPIMTDNRVDIAQSGTFMLQSDGLSPIRYSTNYSSVGGTPMLYLLRIVLEQVAA